MTASDATKTTATATTNTANITPTVTTHAAVAIAAGLERRGEDPFRHLGQDVGGAL